MGHTLHGGSGGAFGIRTDRCHEPSRDTPVSRSETFIHFEGDARNKMATGYTLPPPAILEIHNPQASEKWKKFKRARTNYVLVTEFNKKPEAVQVATLLTVIGEEAREVFSTFTDWAAEGDDAKIEPVLVKFALTLIGIEFSSVPYTFSSLSPLT